jgi:hypothetical protein
MLAEILICVFLTALATAAFAIAGGAPEKYPDENFEKRSPENKTRK